MYTLKIKWMRYENGEVVDETTLFISADQVRTHGEITSIDQMDSWKEGSYLDYSIKGEPGQVHWGCRLIVVEKDGKETYYLASIAWLLGANGQTIERLTA